MAHILVSKKFIVIAVGFLAAAVFVGYSVAQAQSRMAFRSKILLNPVSVLGVSVLRGDMRLEVVDMSDATTSIQYILPPLSRATDGDVYIIKRMGEAPGFPEPTLDVVPTSGQKLDGVVDKLIPIPSGGNYYNHSMMFVADFASSTWWNITLN